MKPYKFAPYLKSTLWGGEAIAPFKGINTDQQQIGESWEISGVPGHESVTVERGQQDDKDLGITLPQLIERHREALVGKSVYQRFGNTFPLLIKFLDSVQESSIQVHPNDELAQRRHGCPGKTEMWYVIKSKPGARMHVGFRKRITPQEYEQLVQSDADGNTGAAFMQVINTQESHEGDLYFLPAGRIHAIGAGNLIAEVQQTSDITYRVYDFGRRDANGEQRPLHVELAKDAIDYEACTDFRKSYNTTRQVSELVNCPHFRVHRAVVHQSAVIDLHRDSFVVVMCLEGDANINGVQVRQGETLLVPAAENTLYIFGTGTFITATM